MKQRMAKPPTPDQPKLTGKSVKKAASKPHRRGGEARAIADLIPAIGDTAFRKFGFVHSAIITRWSEIVGERLARMTAPDSLRFPHGKKSGGTLHISVVGAHAAVVSHILPDIITRTNRFFGYAAVAHVRLKSGRVAPSTPAARAPAQRAAPGAAAAPPNASIRAIADPELRAVLEGLAQSLATRDARTRIG